MNDLYHILTLAHVPGIGHARVRTLISKFGSAENVLRASMTHLTATDGIDKKTSEKIKEHASQLDEVVREQISLIERYQVRCLTFWDNDFPTCLKNIYDPPAFIFVRGSVIEQDQFSVAVVGTREPTPYGRMMADTLCRELAIRGITIISGLARGIDTIAHESALRSGGRTIAVLGCGVDRIYPSSNFRLASEIIHHGAVVSDYPMKTPPDAVNFPGRNRIISGLSLGTLVVEAGERSGALITAGFALDQNRELFAVPGQANVPQSVGTNRLIKQGAQLVDSVDDILSALDAKLPALTTTGKTNPPAEIPISAKIIYDCLSPEPAHIDEIARKANLSVSDALTKLLNLELLGAAKQLAGKHFVKC
jgi:DNA processing protein